MIDLGFLKKLIKLTKMFMEGALTKTKDSKQV